MKEKVKSNISEIFKDFQFAELTISEDTIGRVVITDTDGESIYLDKYEGKRGDRIQIYPSLEAVPPNDDAIVDMPISDFNLLINLLGEVM